MITADPIRAKAAKRAWSISPSPLRYGQVGPRQMTPLPLLLIGALRFSARLKTGAKRILMNMRWHGDDVAGRVLDQIKRGIVRGRVSGSGRE